MVEARITEEIQKAENSIVTYNKRVEESKYPEEQVRQATQAPPEQKFAGLDYQYRECCTLERVKPKLEHEENQTKRSMERTVRVDGQSRKHRNGGHASSDLGGAASKRKI